jgi:hypothetical protein
MKQTPAGENCSGFSSLTTSNFSNNYRMNAEEQVLLVLTLVRKNLKGFFFEYDIFTINYTEGYNTGFNLM